jgi:hypothetical protein
MKQVAYADQLYAINKTQWTFRSNGNICENRTRIMQYLSCYKCSLFVVHKRLTIQSYFSKINVNEWLKKHIRIHGQVGKI